MTISKIDQLMTSEDVDPALKTCVQTLLTEKTQEGGFAVSAPALSTFLTNWLGVDDAPSKSSVLRFRKALVSA